MSNGTVGMGALNLINDARPTGDDSQVINTEKNFQRIDHNGTGDGKCRNIKRVIKKGAGGTTFGEIANTLGVTTSVISADYHNNLGNLSAGLGLGGGGMVLAAGISQVANRKDELDTMKGGLNIGSGALGVASGITALTVENVGVADLLGRFSFLAMAAAELVALMPKLKTIWEGTSTDKEKYGALTGLMKVMGPFSIAVSGPTSLGYFLLVFGNALTGGGVLLSLAAGVDKLYKIFTENIELSDVENQIKNN